MYRDVKYKNILVDACMHLGDLIHATSVIPLLHELFPDAEISFLVNSGLESLFSCIEGVKEVIPYQYKSGGSYLGVYSMAQKIKQHHFDLSISLDPRPRLSIMMWLAGIPCRVGSPSVFGWKPGFEKYFFNKYIDFTGYDFNRHPAAYNFQELIKRFAQISSYRLYVPCFQKSTQKAVEYIDTYIRGISQRSKKIALCVNTVDEARNWPPKNYNTLIKNLLDKYDAIILGVGIKADEDAFLKSITGIDKGRIINLVGKTNFDQLNALFRRCDLLINPDNGMGHFAAAAGCPTVTLFSNTFPEKYRPQHLLAKSVFSGCECVENCSSSLRKTCDKKCINQIKVFDVVNCVDELIYEMELNGEEK